MLDTSKDGTWGNIPVPSLLVPQLVWLQDCSTFTSLPE